MSERPISENAWSRACADSWEFYKRPAFVLSEIFGGPLVGGLTDSWLLGLVFMAALMVAVFIVSLCTAPIRQRNEARRLIEQIVAARTDMGVIGKFIAEGRTLKYAQIKNDDELSAWLTAYDSWVADVGATIEAMFGPAEKELFDTVEGIQAAVVDGSFNERHNLKRLVIDRRLSNLRELVNRHGKG